MGEEKQQAEEAKDEKEEEKKEEKKEEEEQEIVLKVDMHCEACARKVARALKGFEGVEEVSADSKASKVVVKGKAADPAKVCERLQNKSGRKVELISPLHTPPPEEKKEEAKQEEKKDEPPPTPITVVLKIRMHCEACAQVLQKRIRKIQGVESVETDVGNDLVTVKGILDTAKLVDDVFKRARKQAVIIPSEEKKDESNKGGEKKEGGTPDGDQTSIDVKRSEYWASKLYSENAYAYPPQMFSDENPHACSLM